MTNVAFQKTLLIAQHVEGNDFLLPCIPNGGGGPELPGEGLFHG